MKTDISYARVKTDQQSADSYSNRKRGKHSQEMAMMADAMTRTEAVQTVLDAPCGVGRASIWLAQQGYRVAGIDLGDAALARAGKEAADAGVTVSFEKQDLFKLTYQDKSFDATLCFRLLHHFESPQLQSSIVGEICRVSSRYVIISTISPLSFTSMRRRIRYWLSGKPIKQYPVSSSRLDSMFAIAGFEPHGRVKRSALLHSLQLHVYRRK